jgi:hypothetical protein
MPTYDPYTGKPYPASKPGKKDTSGSGPSRSAGGSPGRTGAGQAPNLAPEAPKPRALPEPPANADSSQETNPDVKTPRERGRTRGAQDIAKADIKSTVPPTESEYEKLANAQADQYLSMVHALDPLTSGAALPAIDQNLAQGADKMLGVSGDSGIAGWLDQQTRAAQQQGAGVTAAGAALGQAEDANAVGIAGGLKNLGTAEADLMKAAPYEQLLSSLAAEVPYHLASGYSIPGMTAANTPAWVQQAEKNVGVTPTVAAKGSTPQAQGLLPLPSSSGSTSTSYSPPATQSPPGSPQG